MKILSKINIDNSFGGNFYEKDIKPTWITTENYYDKNFVKPFWNGTEWYETHVEIIVVPASISRMKLSIELLKRNISFNDIIASINSIPSNLFSELDKKIAIVKFEQAVTFDRYNADLNLIATMEGLSQTDVDNIFINGNLI